MVFGPLAATILSIPLCALSSLAFSILSNAAASGLELQMGGWPLIRSWAPALAATTNAPPVIAIAPNRHPNLIRIACLVISSRRREYKGIEGAGPCRTADAFSHHVR